MIADRTPLLPHIVADAVVARWIDWLFTEGRRGVCEQLADKDREVAAYLVDRAEWHFAHALMFRSALLSKRGDKARDTLYAFMYHWMTAQMIRSFPGLRGTVPPSLNGSSGYA